jgi:hypothetical protein
MLQENPMVSIRHGWLVAVLAVGLVPACKKDGKSDVSVDKAGSKDGASGNASGDDLSLLPVDSQIVIGINFAQIQQSAMWKQFEPMMQKKMTPEIQRRMTEFKDKCGIDPMTGVNSVTFGATNVDGDPRVVMVAHGIDKTKAWACLDKVKADLATDNVEYTREGDVGLFKGKDGGAALTFVNDTTAIAVISEKPDAAAVKAAASAGSTLKTSPGFVELYSKIRTTDSVWVLMNGNLKVFDKASSVMGAKPTAVFGSLNIGDGLTLDVRARLPSPDAAAQLANMGKTQVQQAATMFDKIEVTNDGADVKLAVVLSNQKLQALIAQFGPMLGIMGGQ